MINFENVEFAYAKKSVLFVENLTIQKGEKVFLFGPSGTGKTTLLGLLGGVLSAQKGRLTVLDQVLTENSNREKDRFRGNHIGFIFQMFNLIPFLSVKENILLALELGPTKKHKALQRFGTIEKALSHLCQRLQIESLLSKKANEISVGQAQRVAAARALIGDPEIIIADEPTSALDTDRRNEFIDLLFAELSQTKSTLLFVSHDKSLSSKFDRTLDIKEINKIDTRTNS